jgi:hypothetical protein
MVTVSKEGEWPNNAPARPLKAGGSETAALLEVSTEGIGCQTAEPNAPGGKKIVSLRQRPAIQKDRVG